MDNNGLKTLEYDPKIEARRPGYEKLAESLAHMTKLSANRKGGGRLDIEGEDEDDKDHLIEAIDNHVCALWRSLDWRDARTLRRFYVEMRLHADQLALNRKRAHEKYLEQVAHLVARHLDDEEAA